MSKEGDQIMEVQRRHKLARRGKGAKRMASSTRSLFGAIFTRDRRHAAQERAQSGDDHE